MQYDLSPDDIALIVAALELYEASGEDNCREDEAREARALIERLNFVT